MTDPTGQVPVKQDDKFQLKVGAHVLIQLGSELVTDVDQAILECVKNAYDADAPGCTIEVVTTENGESVEEGFSSELKRFDAPAKNVRVAFRDLEKADPQLERPPTTRSRPGFSEAC